MLGTSLKTCPRSDVEMFVYLHIEQIELHRISGVYVLVRVEELSPEQQHLRLLYTLLSQRPSVVQPVH